MRYPKDEQLDALKFWQLAQDRLLIRVLIGHDNERQIHLFTVHEKKLYKFTYYSYYPFVLTIFTTGEGIGKLLQDWVIEADRAYRRGWLTTRQISIIIKSDSGPSEATENIPASALLDFGRIQEQLLRESLRNPKDSTSKVFLRRLEGFLSDHVSDIEAAARRLTGLATRK